MAVDMTGLRVATRRAVPGDPRPMSEADPLLWPEIGPGVDQDSDQRRRWREANERYRSANPERRKAQARATFRRRDPQRVAEYRRKRVLSRHGLTSERFDAMKEEQGGVCAACRRVPGGRGFVIDHDHRCCPGEESCGSCVRGLICDQCNVALGMAHDDRERLLRLVEYLDASR